MPTATSPIPQTIGPRTVHDPKGKIIDYGAGTVWLSMETCGCGHSFARPGVGYHDETLGAWVCKECGEPHTLFTTELEYERDQKARIDHHEQRGTA